MCVQFVCSSCRGTFADHCKDKPSESVPVTDTNTLLTTNEPVNLDGQTTTGEEEAAKPPSKPLPNQPTTWPGLTYLTKPQTCETCIRIREAIQLLETLVYQFPFLTTEGLAGIENLPDWEKKSVKWALCERKKSWDDKAESRDERHKLQEKIEKMGLGGVKDERLEHQGFAMDVTPEIEKEKEESSCGCGM